MADLAINIGQSIAEKAFAESGKGGAASGASSFEKVLTQKLDQTPPLNQQIMESFGASPEKQIQSISAKGLDIQPTQISVNSEIRTHGKTMDLLTEVNRGALQMEDMMQLMTSGQKFTGSELLYLQANMHDIVLRTEMAMKIGEQSASSFKQINQTQI